jgi:hypothetical protein
MNSELSRKLELHYVFHEDDFTHTLDACTRNKCEHAFLQIVCEVARELGVHVQIQVEPHSEGGVRDYYNLILSPKGGNFAQWGSLVVSVITLAMMLPTRQDSKLKELAITEKELRIKKLRMEIAEKEHDGQIDNVPALSHNNTKIKRQKSNFFQKANACPKIHKIEMAEIDVASGKQVPGSVVAVDRAEFDDYIVEEIEIPPEIWENAVIEIIAPVLVKKNYQWKGVHKSNDSTQIIDFLMKDKSFQADVQEQRIAFKHGTHIECVLESIRRADEEGNVFIARHDVTTVNRVYDGSGTDIETIQGKVRKRQIAQEKAQLTLFP